MSEVSNQLATDPISAVGVVTSLNKAPDDYYVVAQTTDGSDADLWKDGLFKSKVNRYLCFTRKTGPDVAVVVDMKVIDVKEALPEGFTPVEETMDTKETAMRKRRLCVKTSPRGAAVTAVHDIQITTKSKYQLVNYTCIGEINNMGVWYRIGDVRQSSQESSSKAKSDAAPNTESPQDVSALLKDVYLSSSAVESTFERRRTTSRPDCELQSSGNYTITALDDVPFVISEKFFEKPKEMQQVNLMGITIKSLAEIEEEFNYNFSTERSIVV